MLDTEWDLVQVWSSAGHEEHRRALLPLQVMKIPFHVIAQGVRWEQASVLSFAPPGLSQDAVLGAQLSPTEDTHCPSPFKGRGSLVTVSIFNHSGCRLCQDYHHDFYSTRVFYSVLPLAELLKGEWAHTGLPKIHIFCSFIFGTLQYLITHSPAASQK